MKKHNVFDVAAYILSKTGAIAPLRLHKLIYYSQAWSLAWYNTPLFYDKIEAWGSGAIIPLLYDYHKYMSVIDSIPYNKCNSLRFTKKQKNTLKLVIYYYGNKTTHYIGELIRSEYPYRLAHYGCDPLARSRKPITHKSMRLYYASL